MKILVGDTDTETDKDTDIDIETETYTDTDKDTDTECVNACYILLCQGKWYLHSVF
jgi:hypothetical protein